MTYPPSGGTPDPYQPQQPYGQPGDPDTPPSYSYSDPYATPPGSPAGSYSPPPSSGQPYGVQPGVQPYGAQQPYGAGFQPAYGHNPATNTMAILSLVFAFVFSPLGIAFGHVAKKQIKQTGEQGEGLATAGMVVGYVVTGIYLLVCCGYAAVIIGLIGAEASGAGAG
jgi:hypothetical protein